MIIEAKVSKFLRQKLGQYVRIEKVSEINLLSDPPIPKILVEGAFIKEDILFKFTTTLSPAQVTPECVDCTITDGCGYIYETGGCRKMGFGG